MTFFINKEGSFFITPASSVDIRTELPAEIFSIKQTPLGELYFSRVDDFKIDGKIYGDSHKMADRILNTYHSRKPSTGVLLIGEKGSGKTLLAKMVSAKAGSEGMPTIIINDPFRGDAFSQLLQSITQKCVVIFDEFEKVYDSEAQEAILTLLDGVFTSSKLFVFTANNKYAINEHMTNRPGRIFYMKEYKGLDKDFITEYCEENLDDKNETKSVVEISTLFRKFNFDMLKGIVEEMNRYKETARDVIKVLNVKPNAMKDTRYEVSLNVNGEEVPLGNLEDRTFYNHPFSMPNFGISYNHYVHSEDKSLPPSFEYLDEKYNIEYMRAEFSTKDVVKDLSRSGNYVFKNKDGDICTLKVHEAYEFSIDEWFAV